MLTTFEKVRACLAFGSVFSMLLGSYIYREELLALAREEKEKMYAEHPIYRKLIQDQMVEKRSLHGTRID